jgi:hypothetical protein
MEQGFLLDGILVPGIKWNRGFFSMGSTALEIAFP